METTNQKQSKMPAFLKGFASAFDISGCTLFLTGEKQGVHYV
jgi:hypothetical protein